MEYTVNISIRVNPLNGVSTLQELALAIHAAASQIDTGSSFDSELGTASVVFQGKRVGQIDVDQVSPAPAQPSANPPAPIQIENVNCPLCGGAGHPPRECGQSCPRCMGHGNFAAYFAATGFLVWRGVKR